MRKSCVVSPELVGRAVESSRRFVEEAFELPGDEFAVTVHDKFAFPSVRTRLS